jgi:sugar lactone lactonase YvrE
VVNVTLTGMNFISGMSVSAGPQISIGNVFVSSSTTATATFTIDSSAIVGSRNVWVTTSGGTSNSQTFTVNATQPAPGSTISTVAGSSIISGLDGDGGPATLARLNGPTAVAVDAAGNLFIADSQNNRIRKVTPAGVITTFVQTLFYPTSIVIDAAGNLLYANPVYHRINKVTPAGVISMIAGNGTLGFSGDGGPATAAQLNSPWGIALDQAGNLYIADTYNYRVRKVTTNGVMTTVAGNGTKGFGGDGGLAASAELFEPWAVAVDAAGNLFIATGGVIRKVTPGGVISTLAGKSMWQSNEPMGDCGPANQAIMLFVQSLAVDVQGNLFIADTHDNRVRRVTNDGVISTVAGTGTGGFSGDGGLATSASLRGPSGVALDAAGNLLIADTANQRIRKVTAPLTSNCSP